MEDNKEINTENKAPDTKRTFKIGYVEMFIIFIVLGILSIYLIPQFMLTLEEKQYGRIQTNAAMMTSKVLSEFSNKNSKLKPSEIAAKLTEEMNKLCKNPIVKENPAYSIDKKCVGCVVLEADDKVKNMVLSARDKEGKLLVRTIIQPPSYVTYQKDLKNKDEK